MSDIQAYLPDSRDYFRKFKSARMGKYKDIEREFGNSSKSGYPRYENDVLIGEYLISIVNNLDEMFENVNIPEKFSSPDELIDTWKSMYSFMLEKEKLLHKTITLLTDGKQRSEAFATIYDVHKEICACLKHILNMNEVKSYEMSTTISNDLVSDTFDVVIITALYDTEFVAFQKCYKDFTERDSGDETVYLQGKIGAKTVLIATDDTMGLAASTALTAKMLTQFKPQYIFMGGIAAGVKSEGSEFGDILVARTTWNYESGKYQFKRHVKQIVFEPNPEHVNVDGSLIKLVNSLKSNEDLLKAIYCDYNIGVKDVKPDCFPKVNFGPIASGSAVVAHIEKIEDIRAVNRKLIGIDMETFGVYYCCKSFESLHRTKFLSVKSISDFADKRKNDNYRNYAGYTSARFIQALIRKLA